MNNPSENDIAKCLYYRRESKKGAPYSAEGQAFCEYMLKTYPEWYKQSEKQVFEDTLPFGARQCNGTTNSKGG